MIRTQRTQKGFVLVSAIFLLVILAALGAFMVSLSNTQQLTSAQDVQGSRSYWAARAGLAWAVSKVSATMPTPVCPAATSTFNVDDFALSVTCSSTAYNEGGTTKTMFSITSVSTTGGSVGSLGYIERSLSATVEF
jgi:MSHA biogenesis protein MshP